MADQRHGQGEQMAGRRGILRGLASGGAQNGARAVAVERLLVGPDDVVVEIGCGPGVGLAHAAARAARGFVAGVDHSPLMVARAGRRLRAAIAAKRAEVRVATVDRLPWPDGVFTRAVAVNSAHLWPDQDRGLREVRRVCAPGARLVLGIRLALERPRRFSSPGLSREEIARLAGRVAGAGFRDVTTEWHDAGRAMACVVAANP